MAELERVEAGGEGEAQRYFDHALVLRHTIRALRYNSALGPLNLALDLVRCESLQSLEPTTRGRLLNKNYALLVSMAPLCREIRYTLCYLRLLQGAFNLSSCCSAICASS